MDRTMNIKIKENYKQWFSGDEFCCSIHISPSKRKHDDVIRLLDKFICSRLNKYLCGSLWKKREYSEQIHFVWFKEGSDIHKNQLRGYYSGSSFIRKELRMKSTEVQSHYHVLVRVPEFVKNTTHMNIDFRNDISTLVEIKLRMILGEYFSIYEESLDMQIRNNHQNDKSQQYYVTKEFGNNDFGENWGII